MSNVDSFDSFIEFLTELENDRRKSVEMEKNNPSSRYGPDAGGWENTNIESFLESMRAWLNDQKTLPKEPTWELFAAALEAGKVYE
ncbi:MAG: hypothetical protein JJ892_15200 [Balneola sp.]|nr:hypothetical protein [Balneola sp.]MBO6652320.1 hypothetical protein [Balneola sp.]MBO6712924.1 hypothetical protein [Balneola sp.]MBO6801618.1 hypothetical protein [Balneola sp.]MBO6871937.1 hypothetical protein [Balneola sp.]